MAEAKEGVVNKLFGELTDADGFKLSAGDEKSVVEAAGAGAATKVGIVNPNGFVPADCVAVAADEPEELGNSLAISEAAPVPRAVKLVILAADVAVLPGTAVTGVATVVTVVCGAIKNL